MKKLLLLLLCILPVSGAWAVTNCTLNACDIVAHLRNNCGPKVFDGYNANFNNYANTFTWVADDRNGGCFVISGIAACLDSDYQGVNPANITANGGETDGQYCFCKMTNPTTGVWLGIENYGTTDKCIDTCAKFCAERVAKDASFRTNVLLHPRAVPDCP